MLSNQRLVSLLLAAALTACADDPTHTPLPLPPLAAGVWHVHESDGQALPALVGHRLVEGNVLEQDFLDWTQLFVEADGRWELRAQYQRYHDGTLLHGGTILDWGTWTATPDAYQFRRNTGELLYVTSGPEDGEWGLNLRYPGEEGVAVSRLRATAPPASVVGTYRATAMHDQPLPRVYIMDPEFFNGVKLVSHHLFIDSARVWLRSNGSYQHRIWYSHWEGPVGGGPEMRLISLSHSDFGSWTAAGTQLTLESGYLQNHVIRGERAANNIGPLRLDHGISHGDEPVPLRYVRE
jgi:hypothetical protein